MYACVILLGYYTCSLIFSCSILVTVFVPAAGTDFFTCMATTFQKEKKKIKTPRNQQQKLVYKGKHEKLT